MREVHIGLPAHRADDRMRFPTFSWARVSASEHGPQRRDLRTDHDVDGDLAWIGTARTGSTDADVQPLVAEALATAEVPGCRLELEDIGSPAPDDHGRRDDVASRFGAVLEEVAVPRFEWHVQAVRAEATPDELIAVRDRLAATPWFELTLFATPRAKVVVTGVADSFGEAVEAAHTCAAATGVSSDTAVVERVLGCWRPRTRP